MNRIEPRRAGRWGIAVALLGFSYGSVKACEAPADRYCVDFFNGTVLGGTPLAHGKAPYLKYHWANRSPARGVPYDHFSARWRGSFEFRDGEYEFRLLADDGARILLDGLPILDRWEDGVEVDYRAKFAPGAGRHLVEVEYFELTGTARLEADWKALPSEREDSSAPSAASTAISETAVFADPAKISVQSNPRSAIAQGTNKVPLGINLSQFNYWSASLPFKDLLMQSDGLDVLKHGSNEPCPQSPALDGEGYPKSLPDGCMFRIRSAFHILEDEFWPAATTPYMPGRYVLIYQGQGRVQLGWDAKRAAEKQRGRIEFEVPTPKDGIEVLVNQSDALDPVRNMHIFHADDESSLQQPFNQRWLDLLDPFSTVRFVDWGRLNDNISAYTGTAVSHTSHSITLANTAPANSGEFDGMVALLNVDDQWPRVLIDHYDGPARTIYLKTPIDVAKSARQLTVQIFDFLNRTPANRASPTTLGQTSSKGVAFEGMLKLANTLDVNPWINIPTAANDDFVEQLAKLIKKTLKPNLKCYIEYSNETWNFGFPGYHYSEAKARELKLDGTAIPADAWHAYRAVEIFKIFNRVFNEADLHENRQQSRLVRVLTSQTAWLDRAKGVMDWRMPDNGWPTQGKPAYQFADAWAVTAYFYLSDNQSLASLTMEEIFAAQIDNINTLFGNENNPGLIRKTLAESKARGLQLIAYEAGTHLTAPQDNSALITKLARVNQDARMTEVYSVLINQWNSLYREAGATSVGVLNLYSDISRYGRYGYWGLLQSTYQDPATAPKYQAIKHYVSNP